MMCPHIIHRFLFCSRYVWLVEGASTFGLQLDVTPLGVNTMFCTDALQTAQSRRDF